MNKIAKALVQVDEHDSEILIRPCFPVNIRLMKTNVGYFNVVEQAINHMKGVIQTKFSDYAALQGISGANVGIPFNIIIIYYDGKLLTMLNPVVISKSKEEGTAIMCFEKDNKFCHRGVIAKELMRQGIGVTAI